MTGKKENLELPANNESGTGDKEPLPKEDQGTTTGITSENPVPGKEQGTALEKRNKDLITGSKGLDANPEVQIPNPNDRAPSFYRKVLDETENLDLAAATEVEGIDAEIAILRIKIKSLLEMDPDNLSLYMALTSLLGRLVRIRYDINKGQKDGFKTALGNVVREILVPLGINVIEKKM